MQLPEVSPASSLAPTFSRLFASLGLGVGAVTLVLWLVRGTPMLAVILSVLIMLLFVGVVMHEAGRLLSDEGANA
jgi:FtsH-binding integral membrane protein